MGVLSWKDSKHSLNNENIILRGCILRNTSWCFGMVIFAGTVDCPGSVMGHPCPELCMGSLYLSRLDDDGSFAPLRY